jgi:hypothetical protein
VPPDAPIAFFSYSRDDSGFVLRLAGDLKATGAHVWLDQLDIEPGQRWARAIQDALNNASRMLVVLSPSSVNSTNVDDEVNFGLEEHKTLVPVLYRDCKIPFRLRPFQYVDFRTSYEGGLKALLKTLAADQPAERITAAPSAVPKEGQPDVFAADDYLSTVSGGGYIGSWLTAWVHRSDYRQAVDHLAGAGPTSGDPEPQPIRQLRGHTSYVAPHYGFTLDTLTLLAIMIRNMGLNWLILVPVLMALSCLPQFLYNFSYAWIFAHQSSGQVWFPVVIGLAVACNLFASATALWRMARPSYTSGFTDPQERGITFRELWLFAVPILVSAWLLGEASAWAYASGTLSGNQWPVLHLAGWFMVYTAVAPLAMSVVRLRLLWQSDGKAQPTVFHKHDGSGRLAWGRLFWSFVAPLLVAALAAFLLAECALNLGSRLMEASSWHFVISHWFVVLMVPIVLGVMMQAWTLVIGLLTDIAGEEERQLWARVRSLLFPFLLGWVALSCLVFFVTDWLRFMSTSILVAMGLGAGYIGSAAGLSRLKRVKAEQLTKFETFLSNHRVIAPVASGIALVCLASALAAATSQLRVNLYNLLINQATSLDPSVLQHYLFHYVGVTVNVTKSVRWVGTLDRLKMDSLATCGVFASVCLFGLLANMFITRNLEYQSSRRRNVRSKV